MHSTIITDDSVAAVVIEVGGAPIGATGKVLDLVESLVTASPDTSHKRKGDGAVMTQAVGSWTKRRHTGKRREMNSSTD